ncbi:MAG TPA: SHD1 domain-containing protein [Thermoguttaceae bacterium]|nr:SHD1 domain-containing protein [Thermoguttaceae bacterium]
MLSRLAVCAVTIGMVSCACCPGELLAAVPTPNAASRDVSKTQHVTEENIEEWVRARIAELEKRLAAAERGRVTSSAKSSVQFVEESGRYMFGTNDAKKAEIERLEHRIQSGDLPAISILNPKVGQIGVLVLRENRLGAAHYRVLQVVDGQRAIIEAAVTLSPPDIPPGVRSTPPPRPERHTWTFFLKGPLVGNLREEQRISSPSDDGPLSGAFKITGMETYTTTIGASRTIHVVEPYAVAPVLARIRTAKEVQMQVEQQPPGAGETEWRTWTTADGRFKTEAKFVKFAMGTLTLEKKDGSTIEVKLDILCSEDQEFVRQRKWTLAQSQQAASDVGLGRTEKQILSNLEEYFLHLEDSSPVQERPRRMAQTPDKLALIEVIGDPRDVHSASVVIGIPKDAPTILIRNTGICLVLLKNALPAWSERVDWFNGALKRIADSPDGSPERIQVGNATVNLNLSKELGLCTLTVKRTE